MAQQKGAWTGENNPRWNGGISKYPQHHIFKKRRLEKLQQTKGACEICGSKAKYVHHMDGNKANHALKNLICVCKDCHGTLHTGSGGRTSKYIRMFGYTLSEMAVVLNTSPTYIREMILKSEHDELRDRLKAAESIGKPNAKK